jgi:hypothetical protein
MMTDRDAPRENESHNKNPRLYSFILGGFLVVDDGDRE